LHQYINQFLNKIDGKITYCKEKTKVEIKNLSQISDDRLSTLRNLRMAFSKRFGGKKGIWLHHYERNFIEYYNCLVERINLESKISFWIEFKNLVESYKLGLNPLHKSLKKPIIQGIEKSLETVLLSNEDIYDRSQLVIEVLENDKDFLEYIYDKAKEEENFIENNNVMLHTNLFVPILLGQEGKEGLFERYLSKDALKEYEEKKLEVKLISEGTELLEKSFTEILDISVWEALEWEAKLTGIIDSNKILSYIKEKVSLLQDEAAQPFWKTADIEGSFPQRLLIGDSESLEKFQKRYPSITIRSLFNEAEFIEFGANKYEIILCYGELGIPIYKQALVESKYKEEFDEMKKQKVLWTDKRLNEDTLPAITPTGLEITTIFLLSEKFGIITPTIDKKGKETGVYNYRKRPLKRGLKGRQNAISWFQSPSATRTAILKELQKEWGKIVPTERKKSFQELEVILKKKSSDKKISEYLRDVYEENRKTVEEAIDKKIYDREEIVPKIFLKE